MCPIGSCNECGAAQFKGRAAGWGPVFTAFVIFCCPPAYLPPAFFRVSSAQFISSATSTQRHFQVQQFNRDVSSLLPRYLLQGQVIPPQGHVFRAVMQVALWTALWGLAHPPSV